MADKPWDHLTDPEKIARLRSDLATACGTLYVHGERIKELERQVRELLEKADSPDQP